MQRIKFNKGHSTNVKRELVKVAKDFFAIVVVLAVIGNTYNYQKLVNMSQSPILIQKVRVNEGMINKLENELLKQGETVKELALNPKDLMKANVIVISWLLEPIGIVEG